MKKIKTITLLSLLIIGLLLTNTNSFAENELDNIEVLTFSVDSMYDKGNLDTNKEKHKKLG
ncbi:MAG: peptidase S41, partial [Finegoldia magna]|nr:peptidase S41 [Finegoldia magna]